MARVERLPPVPAVPPRSPPVAVTGESAVSIQGLQGGPMLDGRLHVPAHPQRAVLLCHPHPLYGGSMHSPVPLAIAKTLADKASERAAWLRFDFRGVGASEGKYDEGKGEVDDALAALALLRERAPGIPLSVAGHSFGSWVGLRAAAKDGHVGSLLLVSPSVRFFDFDDGGEAPPNVVRGPCPITIFVGDLDDLLDVPEAEGLAAKLGATLRVFEGYDHHFMKSRRAMAEAALPVLIPGL